MGDAMGGPERDPSDLSGMDPAAAREYIHAHLTTLKLSLGKAQVAEAEAADWERRAALARDKGLAELQAGAEAQAAAAREKAAALRQEIRALETEIYRMREQLPGLEAKLRSIDPDLLLANLQMATGEMLDDGRAEAARKTDGLLKEATADQELAALKAKMGLAPAQEPSSSSGGSDSAL